MKVYCTGNRRTGRKDKNDRHIMKPCGAEWTTRLETGDIPKKCATCGQHTVKRGKRPDKDKETEPID